MGLLRDLNELGKMVVQNFNESFDARDCQIPKAFKDKVKTLKSFSLVYNSYSVIIKGDGVRSKDSYVPNQLFFMASFFIEYSNELSKYKQKIMPLLENRNDVRDATAFFTHERDKGKEDVDNNNDLFVKILETSGYDEKDKEYLIRFVTDYGWWGGSKTIDRTDFFNSPVLSLMGLTAASNSAMALIVDYLTQNPDDNKLLLNQYESIMKSNDNMNMIFYGAPGTGKSNKIKEEVDDQGKIHYRTTFHPDSDYSTFVGCYKPISHKKNMLAGNGINETQLLSNFFNSNGDDYKGKNKARYLYEALVHTKDIRDLGLDAQMVADKLIAKGFTGCAYTTEANCMYNIYDWLKEDGYIVENKLSYEFIPQTFTKAYVDAWKNQKSGTPVYLIIEEINRGNCAQIFGDLFQLLDRDDEGYSRYEVSPDSDLEDYIASLGLDISGIKNSKGEDISSQIANGKLLKLPNNMYIWATMNTSDQSLFPIDSAFKRRWDWKYIPIDTKKEEWNINVGGSLYSWTAFLEKINNDILTDETAEDKHLGFYFCKADNKEINAEKFVGKVLFYLWNDVFKVYGIPATIGSSKDWAYTKFYNTDGSVDEQKVKDLMKKLDIPALGEEADKTEGQGNE